MVHHLFFRLTPSQMLAQRYQNLQNARRTDELEDRLADVMEGGSGSSTSKSKRTAHSAAGSDRPSTTFKSKLQQQVEARRRATESNPDERTVAHTMKGEQLKVTSKFKFLNISE